MKRPRVVRSVFFREPNGERPPETLEQLLKVGEGRLCRASDMPPEMSRSDMVLYRRGAREGWLPPDKRRAAIEQLTKMLASPTIGPRDRAKAEETLLALQRGAGEGRVISC